MPKKKTRMQKGGPVHKVGQATRLAKEGAEADVEVRRARQKIATENKQMGAKLRAGKVSQEDHDQFIAESEAREWRRTKRSRSTAEAFERFM